ncbi:tail fiber protein, partial [Escherichia coli]
MNLVMSDITRNKLGCYMAQQASLNNIPVSALVSRFTVEPSVQQRFENAVKESTEFTKKINVFGVTDQKGEKILLDTTGPIARTNNGKYTAQNATTTQKGIVQLSSATNSTSETLAATPKAVKAVMDETNKKAPLNSPALTGTPTTPTAAQGTNSTQIASTAFVMAAIAALVDSSPDALNTLNELAAALGNDPNFATTMTNALAGKQPKDATLTALAELATSADKLPYFTGADRAALTALTSVGRAILGKTSTQGVLDY